MWTADALRERAEHAPIARFGTVDEIAHAALFLASPESEFINGVTLSVDGGAVAAGSYMVERYRRRKAAAAGSPPARAPGPISIDNDKRTFVYPIGALARWIGV